MLLEVIYYITIIQAPSESSLLRYQPQSVLVDDPTAIRRISQLQDSFAELNACWDRLQAQVVDKETQVQRVMEFHQGLGEAVQSMARWLDDIELRLFNTPYEANVDKALANNEVCSILRMRQTWTRLWPITRSVLYYV